MSESKTKSVRVRGGGLAKALLMTSALVSAAGAAEVARAQDVSQGASSGQVEQVVVTARRRAEDLQSVPVAVTALSADAVTQLNLRDFQDLRGAVPNLDVTPLATGGANLTIRGIGQGSSQVNVDAKTGFYVDEMYVARQEGNQLYFYDIDNLQVLKGPQGTLFGKNTTAGAFLLNTARPSFDGGGYAKLRVGNFQRIDTEGAINAPISDQVLTRFSWRTQSADGYIRHLLDDKRGNDIGTQSFRGQVRLLPTDRFTIDVLGEYNKSEDNGSESIAVGCRSNASYVRKYDLLHTVPYCSAYPILNQSDGFVSYGGATLSIPTSSLKTDVATGGDYRSNGVPLRTGGGHNNPFNRTDVYTGNLRMNYDLTDDIVLKSITAVRRSRGSWYNPTNNVPNDIYAEYDTTATSQFTQEFNLNGTGIDGRLNYVFGAFYFRQNTHFLQDTGPDWIDPTGYTYDANNQFRSYAFYAQASFKITELIEFTAGGRYNHDKKTGVSNLNLQQNFSGPACGTFGGVDYFVNAFKTGQACNGLLYGKGTDTWTSFDPRFQLSFQATPDMFLYGSVTWGYNAGGFNQQLGSNLPGSGLISYNPEKLKSYEVGAKTEWWDRRVRINADFFYQDYQDIQTTLTVTYNGVSTRAVATGATAHELGIEAEFEVRPTPDLVLRANGAWLKQKYDSIAPGVTTITLTQPVNATPKFSYSLSSEYTFHLGDEKTLTAGLNWRAVGERPSCAPLGSCTVPAYGQLGGRLDYMPSFDSPWTISLWGTNLLDERPQISKNFGGGMGIDRIFYGRPREYGVEIARTF